MAGGLNGDDGSPKQVARRQVHRLFAVVNPHVFEHQVKEPRQVSNGNQDAVDQEPMTPPTLESTILLTPRPALPAKLS